MTSIFSAARRDENAKTYRTYYVMLFPSSGAELTHTRRNRSYVHASNPAAREECRQEGDFVRLMEGGRADRVFRESLWLWREPLRSLSCAGSCANSNTGLVELVSVSALSNRA